MAERRMFAKTIIDSDAFLDMPLSAQALYFHLSMRADDDGFINNPKKIQRMVGCGDDDAKLLVAKRFLIPFDSGVVVIKHWKIHNYIRNDRYKPTVYTKEKAMLTSKENGVYTEADTIGIPSVNQMDTQDRLGKESIDKDSIGEVRERKTDYQKIIDLFNTICKSFPSVRSLSDARKKAIKARLNTYTVDDFKQCFENAEASSFLKGGNNRNWTATFDWLIKDQNMAKVLDGNYNDAKDVGNSSLNNADEFVTAALSRGFSDMFNEPEYVANDPKLKAEAEELKKQLSEIY